MDLALDEGQAARPWSLARIRSDSALTQPRITLPDADQVGPRPNELIKGIGGHGERKKRIPTLQVAQATANRDPSMPAPDRSLSPAQR
jgi:hypothetical protein